MPNSIGDAASLILCIMPRMSILRAALAAILLLASPAALGAEESLSIEHQGVPRHYLMHRPPEKTGTLPLLIYLHGLRPDAWRNHTNGEIDAAADREGFVVAYPEALRHRWNFSGQRDEKVQIGNN